MADAPHRASAAAHHDGVLRLGEVLELVEAGHADLDLRLRQRHRAGVAIRKGSDGGEHVCLRGIAIRVGYVSVPRFGEGTHLKLRMNNGHPTPTALGINNGQGMSRALTAGSPGDGSRGAPRTARKLPAHRGALDRLQLAKIDPRRITGPYGRVAVSWPKPAPQRALLGRKTAKKEA